MSDIVPGKGLQDYKILGKDIKEGMILRMQKHLPCIGELCRRVFCTEGGQTERYFRMMPSSSSVIFPAATMVPFCMMR